MPDDQQVNAALPADRWYVLAVLTVVYSLNIADRFSISTLIEPIREELHLSDSGIAFLTGVPLAVFYVTVGLPIPGPPEPRGRGHIPRMPIPVLARSAA